jgi:hypothetical protein
MNNINNMSYVLLVVVLVLVVMCLFKQCKESFSKESFMVPRRLNAREQLLCQTTGLGFNWKKKDYCKDKIYKINQARECVPFSQHCNKYWGKESETNLKNWCKKTCKPVFNTKDAKEVNARVRCGSILCSSNKIETGRGNNKDSWCYLNCDKGDDRTDSEFLREQGYKKSIPEYRAPNFK